jgi:hypothetical protein
MKALSFMAPEKEEHTETRGLTQIHEYTRFRRQDPLAPNGGMFSITSIVQPHYVQ